MEGLSGFRVRPCLLHHSRYTDIKFPWLALCLRGQILILRLFRNCAYLRFEGTRHKPLSDPLLATDC